MTTAAAAAPRHLYAWTGGVLLVEEVERCQADVGNFLIAKHDSLGGREAELLRNVYGRIG